MIKTRYHFHKCENWHCLKCENWQELFIKLQVFNVVTKGLMTVQPGGAKNPITLNTLHLNR